MQPDVSKDPGARWMLAWQAGDEAAFEQLVEEYSGRLFALFTRFLGSVPEREDLVQETFLRVLRAKHSWQPSARFSTWLYRIAFHLAVNRTQRARPLARLDVGSARDEGGQLPVEGDGRGRTVAGPSEQLERDDVVRAVRQAIANLPEKQRLALILARYESMPLADIAAVMDSSEKAIKSLIHRAREALRASLAPFLAEVSP